MSFYPMTCHAYDAEHRLIEGTADGQRICANAHEVDEHYDHLLSEFYRYPRPAYWRFHTRTGQSLLLVSK